MVFLAEVGKQATVDSRVQCLDAAIEALGETCDIGHLRDGKACIGDGLCCGARRHDFHTSSSESARKFDQTGLVIDRHERATDGA